MEYIVYVIRYRKVVIYVGISKDIKRRQKDHNKGLKTLSNKKQLYTYLRSKNVSNIKLEVLKVFSDENQCKLFEAWLILTYYFSDRFTLKQSLPKRFSYF